MTMHHASKKYESSLKFNDAESICLVHFSSLQQSLFSSSLGLDEDESGVDGVISLKKFLIKSVEFLFACSNSMDNR